MIEPPADGGAPQSVPVSRIAHAFSIQLICRLLGLLASMFSVAMTARYLGPEFYGQLSIAIVFIGMWTSLAHLGLATVIVRRVTSGRGDLERLVRVNSGLALVYCVPLAAVAALSGLFVYDERNVRVMLVVLSVGLLLQTMVTRFEPVFVATVRFTAVAVSDVAGRVGTLLVVVWLVAVGADVIWFAVAQVVPPLLQLLIQGYAAMRHVSVRPVFARREAVDLLRESLPLTAFLVAGLLYSNVDGVILSLLSSDFEVGVYRLALTIAWSTIAVPLVFHSSTLATATGLFARDVDAFAGFLRRSVEVMSFVAMPIAVVGALLAGPLIALFGDDAFVDRGTLTLALLFIAAGLRFISSTLGQGLIASHQQRVLLWLTVTTLGFNIALNVALASRFGAVGAGLALVCTEIFHMTISTWRLRRRCGYRTPMVFLLRLLIPVGASAVVVLLLEGLHVVVILAVAAATYWATSALVGPLKWSDITAFRRKQAIS